MNTKNQLSENRIEKLRAKKFGESQNLKFTVSEKLLQFVADWSIFEEAVIVSADMSFPSDIVKDFLDASGWKNIPLPLVTALEKVKTSLIHMEKMLVFLCRESRFKCENMTLCMKN